MEVNETAGIREYDTEKDSYCSFIGTSNFFRYVLGFNFFVLPS